MKMLHALSKYLVKNYGKMIGRGCFSRVYRKSGEDYVTIISVDKAKDCAAYFGLENTEMGESERGKIPAIFPRVELLEDGEFDKITEKEYNRGNKSLENVKIYRMEYYPKVKSLKSALKPEAWAIYQKLKGVMNGFSIALHHSDYDVIDKYRRAFGEVGEIGKVMNGAIDRLFCYGEDIGFEINPANVAADSAGNLVLLDCWFFRGDLWKIRVNKMREKNMVESR